MIAVGIMIIGALLLSGCARESDHAAPGPSRPTVTAAAPTAAAAPAIALPGEQAQPTGASLPSYEVALASAQADRVHAVNGCDTKQGTPRAACVREADRGYDEARAAAEKLRGSGR